jgi:hypothetical protein
MTGLGRMFVLLQKLTRPDRGSVHDGDWLGGGRRLRERWPGTSDSGECLDPRPQGNPSAGG